MADHQRPRRRGQENRHRHQSGRRHADQQADGRAGKEGRAPPVQRRAERGVQLRRPAGRRGGRGGESGRCGRRCGGRRRRRGREGGRRAGGCRRKGRGACREGR